MSDKKCYIIGGLGCSGKTTFSKKLANSFNIPSFKLDDIYHIVGSKLNIPADKLVYLPMRQTWEKSDIDYGRYKNMETVVREAYLEFFSYNIPSKLVVECEAIFWNEYEYKILTDLLFGHSIKNIILQPDYEQWLINRTNRIKEKGHIPPFRTQAEYIDLCKSYLQHSPNKRIIIKDIKNFECSPTGGTNYQSEEFSNPKWEVFNFPKDMTCKTFLDISCNTGYFSKKASERGAIVTGIDISWQVLDVAMDNVPDGNFHLSRVEDWNFKNKYDYILSSSAFHYYHDREEIIEKISKSTKYFILETPVLAGEEDDIQYQSDFMPNFCALPTKPLLVKWLKKYFDKVEEIGETIQDVGKVGGNRPVYKCTNK